MKKKLSIVLLVVLAFSFFACNKSEPTELSCEDIISAYQEAGYTNIYHSHNDENTEMSSSEKCYLIIYQDENEDSDLVEIRTYSSSEDAEAARETHKYGIATWIIATMFGENRWLISGTYGKIEYSSFNTKMLEPLRNLMK